MLSVVSTGLGSYLLGSSHGFLPVGLSALSTGIRSLRWSVPSNNNIGQAQHFLHEKTTCTDNEKHLPGFALPPGPASSRSCRSGLQSAKLCCITGLCSRTTTKIINTNMRCPTCILSNASIDDTSTMFPAVPVDQTVKLLHHRSEASPVVLPATPPSKESSYNVSHLGGATAAVNAIRSYRMRAADSVAAAASTANMPPPAAPSSHTSSLNSHMPANASLAMPFSSWEMTPAGYRTYSAVPERPHASNAASSASKTDAGTSSAVADSGPASASPTPVAGLLPAWLRRTRGRLEGISRKFVFRVLNKRVVRQMARRATIGFPIIGFFFVMRLLVRDFARVRAEAAAGRKGIAGLFSVALVCDTVDLVSQALLLAGMAHAHYGIGAGVAAEILAAADKGTVAMAITSFSAGVAGELLTVLREEKHQAAMTEGEAAQHGEKKE